MRDVSNWEERLPTKRRKPPAAAEGFPHINHQETITDP